MKTRGGESGPANIPDLLRELASPKEVIMHLNFFSTKSAPGDENDHLSSKQVMSGKVVVECSPRAEGVSQGDSFAPDEGRSGEGRAQGTDHIPCRAERKVGGLRGPGDRIGIVAYKGGQYLRPQVVHFQCGTGR